MTQVSAPLEERTSSPGLTQTARIVDTFVAPSLAFADIRRNASWWLPFLLATLFSLTSAWVIDRQVGFDTVVQNSLHDSPKQEERISALEPGQRATQLRMMKNSYRYATYASPVFILAVSALGALVLWGSFNFGLGAKATFGQMFAVWMYASLPRLLTSVLMVAMLLFGADKDAFDLKNPVGTNPAFYLPNGSPWLRSLLGFGDVIGIWVVVLLVIGTATVAKVKRGQAAVVAVGWWTLMLILSVVAAAATS